jgi:VIT1/CCC1 family predicted Fe2+/Mn2+ transporter
MRRERNNPPRVGLERTPMTIGTELSRLFASLRASAGTIVFGMEDGTVSIFGLVFGVAATTSSSVAVLVAGTSGAAAAAVSMMAGAYLDAETSLDERRTGVERLEADLAKSHAEMAATLTTRLLEAGLPSPESAALVSAVTPDPLALKGLLIALQADPEPQSPRTQALWMLFADFFSAAVPIVPFMLLPVAQGRIVSGVITLALLAALGVGRGRIGKRDVSRTVVETVAMGVAAALAGVALGLVIDRAFGG